MVRCTIDASVSSDIQAVDRVARILDLFDHQTIELSAAEAAVRLGLKRTTVQRDFASILGVGLFERGSVAETCSPGRVLAQLGAPALGRVWLDASPGEPRSETWRLPVGRGMDSKLQVAPILTVLVRLIARQAQVHLLAACRLVAHGTKRKVRTTHRRPDGCPYVDLFHPDR